jgi:hypothetical protein
VHHLNIVIRQHRQYHLFVDVLLSLADDIHREGIIDISYAGERRRTSASGRKRKRGVDNDNNNQEQSKRK